VERLQTFSKSCQQRCKAYLLKFKLWDYSLWYQSRPLEAERSFSALRRSKTWLRTTMTQQRLNLVAVCHIHQEKLDLLTKKSVCTQFISFTLWHKPVFGAFIWIAQQYL
jgi:hypothetical protein